MQPTYFASFLLGEDSEAPVPGVGDALDVIAGWIFDNPYRPLVRPAAWPDGISDPIQFPKGERVQLLRLIEGGQVQTAAVRFEHPDDQSRLWRTDCVITTVTNPGPALRFAVTVAAGSSGEGLFPVSPPRTRPRIVRSMMDRFGARESFPLKPTFLRIEAKEAERFVSFLLDPERSMPVVFISRRNQDGQLPCDPSEISDKLVGIAYVCAANEIQLSWEIAKHIDNRLNTYDGAVRLYWPRMTATDLPYRHRLWTPHRLLWMEGVGRSLADELLSIIAAASVTRHVPALVRWEEVEREITRQAMQQLQAGAAASSSVPQDFSDWLRKYEDDLATLDATRQKLDDTSERLREKEEEVRQWKQMYLQSLRAKSVVSDKALDEVPTIEDVQTAIESAARDFKDRLIFIDGRVQKETREFEEPELLYAALNWLATVYWNAKAGVERCADLDKSCREFCQFRYSAHQSEITMGMFSTDYEVDWESHKIKLKEHVGFGTSTEPRHTIRVAFFFDSTKRKVVIGYVGQHQATRRSN